MSRGYVTASPANREWLGLATQDGRDAIQLAQDGCDQVEPGVNVMMITDETGVLWLQVIDPISGVQDDVCGVTARMHMSDVPCGQNPDGVCDVAWP